MGFVLGAALAARLGVGFLPVRKAGKLCVDTDAVSFTNYSGRSQQMEMRLPAFAPGTGSCWPTNGSRPAERWRAPSPSSSARRAVSAAWSPSPSRHPSAPERSAETIPASPPSCPARAGSGNATRSRYRASTTTGRSMPFQRLPEVSVRAPGTACRAGRSKRAGSRTCAGAMPARDTVRRLMARADRSPSICKAAGIPHFEVPTHPGCSHALPAGHAARPAIATCPGMQRPTGIPGRKERRETNPAFAARCVQGGCEAVSHADRRAAGQGVSVPSSLGELVNDGSVTCLTALSYRVEQGGAGDGSVPIRASHSIAAFSTPNQLDLMTWPRKSHRETQKSCGSVCTVDLCASLSLWRPAPWPDPA